MNIDLIFGGGVPEDFDVIRRNYTQVFLMDMVLTTTAKIPLFFLR